MRLLYSQLHQYNSYREIIWLINLMNRNDRRATIEVKDVFAADGSFKRTVANKLERSFDAQSNWLCLFVRGENP